MTKRAQIFFKYKELLESNREELIDLITAEHGKVPADAAGSLQRGIEVVDFLWHSSFAKGEFSEQVGTGIDCYSTRQPIGVCSGVTAFNFPAMVPMWMFQLPLLVGIRLS